MRGVARGLGVGVKLHYLDAPTDELRRRIEARNSEPPWDSDPIRRADFDGWLGVFQAPDAAEIALFDSPPDST
jgi:predicted kinase